MLVESGIYGSATIAHIMKDKASNKGIRTHKLMNEPLNRLKWDAHFQSDRTDILTDDEKVKISEKATKCIQSLQNSQKMNDDKVTEIYVRDFIKAFQPAQNVMNDFTEWGKKMLRNIALLVQLYK
jgi:hypothetical protein